MVGRLCSSRDANLESEPHLLSATYLPKGLPTYYTVHINTGLGG